MQGLTVAALSNPVQTSFLGGEWSPYVQGRIDRPDYKTGMNVCRNGFPLEEGAWTRRPGTRFCATTLNGQYARVISLPFEQSSPYLMELSNQAIRMFAVAGQTQNLSATLAAEPVLVTTNDNQYVASISTANPAVVQTASAHGWSTGDQIEFLFADVAPTRMPLVQNRVFAITVVDTTHFSIADPIIGATIDGSTLGWNALISPGQVTVARILNLTTPYAAADLPLVRKVQAELSTLFFHGNYQPQIISVTAMPSGGTFATFTAPAGLSFLDGPYLDPITGNNLTGWASFNPGGTQTLNAASMAGINGGSGFQSTDVGRAIRLFWQPNNYVLGAAYSIGTSVAYNDAYFTCIQAVPNGSDYLPDVAISYWQVSTSAALWVWGLITSVTSTTSVQVQIQSSASGPLVNTWPAYTNSNSQVVLWRLGAYSNTTGWPTCGAYHEGRIWLAGAIPNRIDGSVSDSLNAAGTTFVRGGYISRNSGTHRPAGGSSSSSLNFSPTAVDGTVADYNGITGVFNSEDQNPILWMLGTQTALICGTQSGEWIVQSSTTSNPITPSNIQAHRVTQYGSANMEPVHTDLTISFVQRYSRKVLEYFPDVFSGRYTAPNLSQTAKHLTTPFIQEIRYQRELAPIIWARNRDGSLIGCTYKRTSLFSSQGPEFAGWHHHDLGSGRTVQSIAVGPSADGTVDALAMTTLDPATGVYHVEVMEPIFDVNQPITQAWFLDDAVAPSGGVINVNPTTGNTLTLYGMWHLNGKTVTVWCGGVDAGDVTVTNGAVTVPIDASLTATFTTAYLQSLSSPTVYGSLTCPIQYGNATLYVPCVVGFTFTSQGQQLRQDAVDQARSPTGAGLGKVRRAQQFAALLANTQGISFGTSFAKLHTANFKQPNGQAYAPTQLFNGVYWDTLDDTPSFDSMACWQVSRPYPATVCSIGPFNQTQER